MDLGPSSGDTAVDLAEYGEEDNMSVSGLSSDCIHGELNNECADSISSDNDELS